MAGKTAEERIVAIDEKIRQRWSVAREQVRGGANAALSSIDKKVRGATHRGNRQHGPDAHRQPSPPNGSNHSGCVSFLNPLGLV